MHDSAGRFSSASSQQNPQYAQAALNFLERYFYLLLFSMWVKEKFDKVDEVTIEWIDCTY